MLIEILSLAAGVLLLLAGRRLFWLAVGMAACLLSWRALASLLGSGWLPLALSVLAGLACAWLTVRFVRTVALLTGFLAGAMLLPAGANLLGIETGWYALALAGGLAAGLAIAISWLRPPLPSVHDEFSYLLAADTFSHGRLTNPTHPMWEHFETPHEIQQPTYASKYPPGQGLILALGQVTAGHPVVGLWISVALAAAATTWMSRAWMPRRWALLGGLLVALHTGIQLIWTQTYWGGNVAFIGGALVLGAYARLRRAPRCRDAVWLALGLAILANSRPFEGAVASLPVALAMLHRK